MDLQGTPENIALHYNDKVCTPNIDNIIRYALMSSKTPVDGFLDQIFFCSRKRGDNFI